jgi:hypothetical protein
LIVESSFATIIYATAAIAEGVSFNREGICRSPSNVPPLGTETVQLVGQDAPCVGPCPTIEKNAAF